MVYVTAGLYGIGSGCYLAVDYALALDCLPPGRGSSELLGLWGIASFLGSSFGPMVGGALLEVGHVDKEKLLDGKFASANYSFTGYAAMLSFGIFMSFLAGWVTR